MQEIITIVLLKKMKIGNYVNVRKFIITAKIKIYNILSE